MSYTTEEGEVLVAPLTSEEDKPYVPAVGDVVVVWTEHEGRPDWNRIGFARRGSLRTIWYISPHDGTVYSPMKNHSSGKMHVLSETSIIPEKISAIELQSLYDQYDYKTGRKK